MTDLQFSGDWFSKNIPLWTGILKPLQRKPDIHALEIGSFEGRSTCWLLQNILTDPTSRLTCIDLFDRPAQDDLDALDTDKFAIDDLIIPTESRFLENIHAIGAEDRVRIFKGASRMILPTLEPDQFDLIYIDGSHLARNVHADAELSWPLLKQHGLMIFDDYAVQMYKNPADNPKAGVDAFVRDHSGELTIEYQDYQMIVRKR